jgi:hypothetical protein
MNVGDDFAPSHPLVRTHAVTGWKTLCAVVGIHVSRINDVYDYEDKMIRDYMIRLITRNHDCIARMHWTKYSAAIWNNACVFHAATVSDEPLLLENLKFVHGLLTSRPSLIRSWYPAVSVSEYVRHLSVKSHILIRILSRDVRVWACPLFEQGMGDWDGK